MMFGMYLNSKSPGLFFDCLEKSKTKARLYREGKKRKKAQSV